jgi:hypothetical protein
MIGVFGFFMGVPVCNILPGTLLAYISGVWIATGEKQDEATAQNVRNRIKLLVTGELVFFLAASATLALRDPYTGANLEGMFKLDFTVTRTHLYLLIGFGGVFLAVLQYLLAGSLFSLGLRRGQPATMAISGMQQHD